MDQDIDEEPPIRAFAADEDGNAAIELALVAGLAAILALTMKELLAMPLLSVFTKASKVLSQVLAG
jgi:Flp pilus assembly pilin Flp